MVTLLQGNCLELMQDIPDGSIDLILCDLPYGTTASTWDKAIPMDKLWEQYNRVLTNTGTVLLFANGIFTPRVMLFYKKYSSSLPDYEVSTYCDYGYYCSGFKEQ